VEDIDWESWKPVDRATLLFVIRGEEILLIRKKRGLGAGKINGPGGRIAPGESPLEGAVRETREELVVTPTDVRWMGEHRFQFVDGYSIHVHVFAANACEGVPHETEEAAPIWTPVNAIPYDEMWEDDRLWLPLLLEGKKFSGRWIFDGERMLDHSLEALQS
jgi:8-oxo-dGTP diphosphatase